MNRLVYLSRLTFQTNFLCSFFSNHFKSYRSLLFVLSYLEYQTGGVYEVCDIKALDGLQRHASV